jgi:hypothetical protein
VQQFGAPALARHLEVEGDMHGQHPPPGGSTAANTKFAVWSGYFFFINKKLLFISF